jgi:hypothetical protein
MAYRLVPTFFVKMSRLAFWRYEGETKKCCEIANQPPFGRWDAALHGIVVALLLVFHGRFFDFLERQLLVLVLRRVQGRTREAAVEEGVADRLVAVVRQLQVQLRRDGAAPTLATSWRTSMT